MQSPHAYLAAQVVTEGKTVSYRTLSRYLGISSNKAKAILQGFYNHETVKSPGSVNATYLIAGVIETLHCADAQQHGLDDNVEGPVQSSPFMGSSAPLEVGAESQSSVKVMSLVDEDHLQKIKARYLEVSSIHIYSLGPSRIQNMQILADGNRALTLRYVVGKPLDCGNQFGIIRNKRAKYTTNGRAIPAVPSFSAVPPAISTRGDSQEGNKIGSEKAQTLERHSLNAKPMFQAEPKLGNKSDNVKKAVKNTKTKLHNNKREPSDIFKPFSHSRLKLDRGNSTSSDQPISEVDGADSHGDSSFKEDEPMRDASENEDAGGPIPQPTAREHDPRKYIDRTEKLRQMMEEEDEAVDQLVENSSPTFQASSGPGPPLSVEPLDDSPLDSHIPTSSGHRKGRRKVMKKKMLKDEEGYLVTKEEPSWESFSEDEPPVQKTKLTTSTAASLGKAKKTGSKHGQGNIMSFFGQK